MDDHTKTPEERELAEILKRIGPGEIACVLLFCKALSLDKKGKNAATREGMRSRLLLIEGIWKGISLRSERGKARRGVLRPDDLQVLQEGFGISPDWVLTGDTTALRHGLEKFLARRAAA